MKKDDLNKFVEHQERLREKYIAEAKKASIQAQANPKAYKRQVSLFATLGYLYLIGMMILLIGVLVGLVYAGIFLHAGAAIIKLAIVIVPVILLMARSLWFVSPLPKTPQLSEKEAPELHAIVRQIARKVGYRYHPTILVSHNVEAAVIEIPRIGPFGPYRRYLLLGLPFLESTAPEEAQAVIAHEFGHFAGGHTRFGVRIYRIQQTWEMLAANLVASQNGSTFLFKSFVEWYLPRLDAISQAVRRQQEYEADAAAVEAFGSAAFSNALIRIVCSQDRAIREFWTKLAEQTKILPAPPPNLLADLLALVRSQEEPERQRETLEEALKHQGSDFDSHPSLANRLRAVNQPVAIDKILAKLVPLQETAADHLLGRARTLAIERISAEIMPSIVRGWKKQYEETAATAQRLAEISSGAEADASGENSRDKRLEVAGLTYKLSGAAAAIPPLRDLIREFPNDPEIRFGLATCLLETNDAEGVPLMEACLIETPRQEQSGLRTLVAYYGEVKDEKALRVVAERLRQSELKSDYADKELGLIRVTDQYVAHDLDPVTVRALQEQIRKRKDVERAYWVRKVIPEMPDASRLVVILLNRRWGWTSVMPATLLEKFLKQTEMPAATLVYAVESHKPWRKKLDSIPGAVIYDYKNRP